MCPLLVERGNNQGHAHCLLYLPNDDRGGHREYIKRERGLRLFKLIILDLFLEVLSIVVLKMCFGTSTYLKTYSCIYTLGDVQ